MNRIIIAFAGAVLLAPVGASAQSAAEIYSYKAPSGMFGDGTFQWNLYRYMTEDAEYRERLRNDPDLATGSVNPPVSSQGTAVNGDQVARPGEGGARRRSAR